MKYQLISLALIVLLSSNWAFAQDNEEERIKAAVLAESTTFFKRDADGWRNMWIQDEHSTRTFASSVGISSAVGWEKFGPNIVQWINNNPEPSLVEVSNDNYLITRAGDMAWVEYDQTLTNPEDDGYIQLTRQQRALMKIDGEWKVRTQVSLQTFSFDMSSPQIVEGVTNGMGYNLMAAEHFDKAIEIFSLNTKWFPESWNVYDSLGEAYMKAGEKEAAIEYYTKSIELNPDNAGGKEALAKLKGE